MKLEYYIKRNRTSLELFCKKLKIDSYESLQEYCKIAGIKVPKKEEIKYEFKKDVEKRPVIKSSTKKKRVSSQKSIKSKTDAGTSAGGSKSKQRIRKSSIERKRKPDSDKVEPVQPSSGSEDTK